MSELKNLQGSINLTKLNNVQLLKVTTNGESRTCVCIPVKNNDLYFHKGGGIFLGLNVIEAKDIRYENTHFVKQSHSKKYNEALTDEDRKLQPILGSFRPLYFGNTVPAPTAYVSAEPVEDTESMNDLPF